MPKPPSRLRSQFRNWRVRGVNTGQTFTINSLIANGSGTAGLSCGADCGWTFNIQVARNREIFNLVDVVNDGNYLAGTAVRQ